jgi:hypothetical protein
MQAGTFRMTVIEADKRETEDHQQAEAMLRLADRIAPDCKN